MTADLFQLKAIVAMASNRVIGRDGTLPWHLPEDLKFFKRTTLDHPILMGRKTFESLPGLLPRRRHLILSRTLTTPPKGTEIISSPADLASLDISGTIFVIGGAQIFETLFPHCSELFLTYIFHPHEGDTHLPPFEETFKLVETLDETPAFKLCRYENQSPRPVTP
ncbi:MAG: dihydrofolate reductase [Verrucomicrobiota bacterium]